MHCSVWPAVSPHAITPSLINKTSHWLTLHRPSNDLHHNNDNDAREAREEFMWRQKKFCRSVRRWGFGLLTLLWVMVVPLWISRPNQTWQLGNCNFAFLAMFYWLHILLEYFFQPDQKLFQMVLLCNAGQVFNVIIECTGAGGHRPIYLVRRLGTGQATWCSIAWLIWHGKALHAMIRYGFIWHGMVWHGKALHAMIWYGIIWIGMVWFYMAWYGMAR